VNKTLAEKCDGSNRPGIHFDENPLSLPLSETGRSSTAASPSLTNNESSGKARLDEDVFSPSETSVA
jgi:hypothetical protein